MLALFTDLLKSRKISGPRLELIVNRRVVQRKRARDTSKLDVLESAETPESEKVMENVPKTMSELGIVETTEGFQYHPELLDVPNPKRKRVDKEKEKTVVKESVRSVKQREVQETRVKAHKKTPCRFYQRGRCTKKECEYLHEGVAPLCYNMLQGDRCDNVECFYSHDTKQVGCMFFHVTHNCSRGDECKFSHEEMNERQLMELRRIHDEVEMEKKSTMPADLAKAMLGSSMTVVSEEQSKPSFEDVPSLMPISELSRTDDNGYEDDVKPDADDESTPVNQEGDDDDKDNNDDDSSGDMFF